MNCNDLDVQKIDNIIGVTKGIKRSITSMLNKKIVVPILIVSVLLLTAYVLYANAVGNIDNIKSPIGQLVINRYSPECTNTEPLKHVYEPERLTVLSPCETVSGTILKMVNETDGDIHIRLKVDPQYADMLNKANYDGDNISIGIICKLDKLGVTPTETAALPCGNLVVEIICASGISDKDAKDACMGYENKIEMPKVNDHVIVTGQFVSDTHHGGWNEIHPVYGINIE